MVGYSLIQSRRDASASSGSTPRERDESPARIWIYFWLIRRYPRMNGNIEEMYKRASGEFVMERGFDGPKFRSASKMSINAE